MKLTLPLSFRDIQPPELSLLLSGYCILLPVPPKQMVNPSIWANSSTLSNEPFYTDPTSR